MEPLYTVCPWAQLEHPVFAVPSHITSPAQLEQLENGLPQSLKQSPHPPQGAQLIP